MNIENLTIGEISIALGFLVGLVAVLKQALKPLTDFEKRVKKIEEHQNNDNERLDQLEGDTKQIMLSVNALMQHSIDGNHTEELRKRKEAMDKYLIER